MSLVELGKALGRSQGIVEKKSTMPILSHVLLEARKAGQPVVSATDLGLAVWIPAAVRDTRTCCYAPFVEAH